MLNNNEISKLKEYIYNASDEEVNKYMDNEWISIDQFKKSFSPLEAIVKTREGKFDMFDVEDKFFRVEDENYVSTKVIKISVEERKKIVEKMLNNSERTIPEAVREAIGWKEKDFDFTKFVYGNSFHWEAEGYSYYLKVKNIYNIKDFRIVITSIGSQLYQEIKKYAIKIRQLSIEEGMNLIDIWWNKRFKDKKMHPVEPLDTRYYYSAPEAPYLNNDLCRFGNWTSCDGFFKDIGLVAKFKREYDDGSFDGLIAGLEYGEYC